MSMKQIRIVLVCMVIALPLTINGQPVFASNKTISANQYSYSNSKITDAVFNASVDEANAYYKRGQYQNAIEDYSRAINLSPKTVFSYSARAAGAYSLRASAFEKIRRYDKAIDDLNRAIILAPKD